MCVNACKNEVIIERYRICHMVANHRLLLITLSHGFACSVTFIVFIPLIACDFMELHPFLWYLCKHGRT